MKILILFIILVLGINTVEARHFGKCRNHKRAKYAMSAKSHRSNKHFMKMARKGYIGLR